MPDKKEIVLQKCKNAIDSGEPVVDYSFYYEVIALLKEQEPVEADTKTVGMPNGCDIEVFCCRNCRFPIDIAFHYCPNCGREVKWK